MLYNQSLTQRLTHSCLCQNDLLQSRCFVARVRLRDFSRAVKTAARPMEAKLLPGRIGLLAFLMNKNADSLALNADFDVED